MIFASLLTSLLLATATLSAPNGQVTHSHHARDRRTGHLQRLDSADVSFAPDISHVYTVNWAGAVFKSAAGTYNKVVGTFTVPTLSSPDGAAAVWVGIDGASCLNAILQTGIAFSLEGGQVTYKAWYEWYPDSSHFFDNISINAGDVVRLTVSADTTTSGTALIENLTNGQTASQALTSSYALCGQDAEWIVEDFKYGDAYVPFANFGTINFTDASASGSGGSISPAGAPVMDIQQNGEVFTSSSADSNGVVIQRL